MQAQQTQLMQQHTQLLLQFESLRLSDRAATPPPLPPTVSTDALASLVAHPLLSDEDNLYARLQQAVRQNPRRLHVSSPHFRGQQHPPHRYPRPLPAHPPRQISAAVLLASGQPLHLPVASVPPSVSPLHHLRRPPATPACGQLCPQHPSRHMAFPSPRRGRHPGLPPPHTRAALILGQVAILSECTPLLRCPTTALRLARLPATALTGRQSAAGPTPGALAALPLRPCKRTSSPFEPFQVPW